jgi:hypothetical protein
MRRENKAKQSQFMVSGPVLSSVEGVEPFRLFEFFTEIRSPITFKSLL